MTNLILTTLGEISNNFNNLRVPLSVQEREKLKKIYPYYGAQGVIDFVDNYLFDGEYILVAEDGENLRSQKNNICNLVRGKFWVNNHAHIIDASSGNDTKYLYYKLNLVNFKNYVTGSAQPKLTKDNLGSIVLHVHEKSEQKKIARVLSSLDQKIDCNNRISIELDSIIKTLYDYWFVQFDFPDVNGRPYRSSGGKMVYNLALNKEIPDGWSSCSLGNHISFKRGISYKSSEIQDVGIPFINLNSFKLDGSFKSDGTKFFNGKYKSEALLNEGDLVIAITDVTRNADIIGKAFVLGDVFHEKPLMSCDVAAVYSDTFGSYYLEQLFNSYPYHSYIRHFASGTLVLHLDLNGVNWYETILPAADILKRFELICGSILKQRDIALKENSYLNSLRDWLLPMLMNGQVTVT